jgi:hypothetical protein
MTQTQVIIVNKDATLSPYTIKEFSEDKLFKKCGFKSSTGFQCFATWSVKISKTKHVVSLYGKIQGKTTSENKYEFPPPADNLLLLGNALLVGMKKNDVGEMVPSNLTVDEWKLIENKLIGGVDNLDELAEEDDQEEDELANVPDNMKTKSGYLKDGFVVSSDDDDYENEKGVAPLSKETKKKPSRTKKSAKNKPDASEKKTVLLAEEEYEY